MRLCKIQYAFNDSVSSHALEVMFTVSLSSAHRTILELQLWEQNKMNWRFVFYLPKLFQGRQGLDWGCFWRVCTWSSPFRGCRTRTAVRGTSSDYSVGSNFKKNKLIVYRVPENLNKGSFEIGAYIIHQLLTCTMYIVNFTCWNKKKAWKTNL